MLNLIVPIVLALAEFFRWQGRRAGRGQRNEQTLPGGVSTETQKPRNRAS